MNEPVVQLTDRQFAMLIDVMADKALDRIEKKLGSLDEFLLLDLPTVGRMTGLTRPTIRKRLPVIEDGQKHSVAVGDLARWRAKHTKTPKGWNPNDH